MSAFRNRLSGARHFALCVRQSVLYVVEEAFLFFYIYFVDRPRKTAY
jgi:hypothetical protein